MFVLPLATRSRPPAGGLEMPGRYQNRRMCDVDIPRIEHLEGLQEDDCGGGETAKCRPGAARHVSRGGGSDVDSPG